MSERRYTPLPGARIHSVHEGTGPDVVLLHGLSGSRHWWRHTLAALGETHRVHVPELVGFGRSRGRWRQPGIDALARLMVEWLETQRIVRPHLVGHSMGGQIALHMAAATGVELRSLTLVCASGIPRGLRMRDAARLLAGALPPRRWGAPGFLPTIALDAMRAGPSRLAQAGWHLLADDVRPLLPRIRVPALVIWGALDPLLPLAHGEAIAAGIAGARLVVLADAAHNPMVDDPAAFNRVLLDFLEQHE